MKKRSLGIIWLFMLTLMISVGTNASFANSERSIKVWIGDFYVMSDVHPFVESGRTYVPIRFIAEELGFEVSWDSTKQEVTVVKAKKAITLEIGSVTVHVNDGSKVTLDTPAKLHQGRTFIPLRAIAELFGEKVEYDAKTKVAMIGENFLASEFYPLKYYLKNDVFITNSKVNFVDYIIKYSNGNIQNLNSDAEVLRLIDKDAKLYIPLGFVSKVAPDKQLFDKFYVAPIKEDEFVGSWYGITKRYGTSEYYDLYVYIEKLGDKRYLFKRRVIKPNGSELRVEGFALYNPEGKIMRSEESHRTTFASGDFTYEWVYHGGSDILKEFDYFESTADSKMYMRKF